MIPLPFIEPKAGYPIYRLKLERLQQLLPGASPGLDTICDGILAKAPFVLRDRRSAKADPRKSAPASIRRATSVESVRGSSTLDLLFHSRFVISLLASVALCAARPPHGACARRRRAAAR